MERSKNCSRKRRQGSWENQRVEVGGGGGGVGLSHVPFRWGMRGLGRVVPPRTSNLALFYLGQKLLIALSCWYHIRRLFTAKFTTHTRLPV